MFPVPSISGDLVRYKFVMETWIVESSNRLKVMKLYYFRIPKIVKRIDQLLGKFLTCPCWIVKLVFL